MSDANSNHKKIYLLQSNLSSIRKIAGLTAEQLGEDIGVSKQTISNLENMKNPMSQTQYIAIRAVLDFRIESNKENTVLPTVVHLLLDWEQEYDDDVYIRISEALKAIAASAAAGITGVTLAAVLTGVLTTFGLIGLISGGAVLGTVGASAVAGTAGWLKNILNKNNK